MQGKTRQYLGILLTGVLLAGMRGACQSGSSPLQISFGSNGLQSLSYNGTTLEDLGTSPGDTFYIGHMKSTDLSGNVLTTGQYGWGELNNGRSWDAASHAWTYKFNWGSIRVQYVQNGTNLDLVVTTANNAGSGIVFDGAAVFPLVLHFPQLPSGFQDHSYPQFAYNTTAPSVTLADYGAGEVVAVAPDASKPLYSGFNPSAGSGFAYATEISGTTPDGLATFLPHNDRPVSPGQTDQYTVSLRFAASGTSLATLASDAFQSWNSIYPSALNWTDRRAIGTVYLASSPSGDPTKPGGYPTNPRRFFNSSSVNINTPDGLASFQKSLLSEASDIVNNLKQLGAQGMITWDIEGEQYPQATSYVCSPDQIGQVAPEMESTVTDAGSPYKGMKLDDAYFQTIRSAGFRVGVCLRPQHFTLNPDGTAQQVYLDQSLIAAELIRKAKYAHDRWGATLFYVDSTVDLIGSVLPAAIFQQVQAAVPDSLFIPEQTTPLHYAYTAPFKSFIDLGALGTDPNTLLFYPHAFSAILVNDADAGKLAAAQAQLTAQVRQGDILMAHADYWQDNDPTVVAIYKAAGVSSAPPTGSGSGDSGGSGSGSSDSGGSGSGSGSSSGSSGSGDSGSSGSSGSSSGSGGSDSGSSSGSSGDSGSGQTPAPPVVSPTIPSTPDKIAIVTPTGGQTVSGTIQIQGVINDALDAAGTHLIVDGYDLWSTRRVEGPYGYPLDTTTLPNGAHTIQLWGHDIANNTILSTVVSVVVNN